MTAASRLADWLTLAKVRVNALVVATTAGGYYMAGPASLDWWRLGATCAGTALVASGAASLNQIYERETDRVMQRTKHRPVADGRIQVAEAMTGALFLCLAGLGLLAAYAGWPATLVALATLVSYAWIYTPLKRHTSLSTIVGAVPGALPPLIGWAAAGAPLTHAAPWTIFAIMFLWQLPHFLAIAWIYREDYARAGLPMLPVIDRDGAMTGRQAALWATTLVPFSVLPAVMGLSGTVYVIGAVTLGLLQLAVAVQFAVRRTGPNARLLFYASITYLLLLWALMAADRT